MLMDRWVSTAEPGSLKEEKNNMKWVLIKPSFNYADNHLRSKLITETIQTTR